MALPLLHVLSIFKRYPSWISSRSNLASSVAPTHFLWLSTCMPQNRTSSYAHSCIIFSSYVFRPAMDSSDESATGRGGSIGCNTYRHLLAFHSRIYALCSMEHFQISCTLQLVGYNWHFDLHILCTCDVPQFVISLWCNFDFFVLTAHALRWGITSVLSLSSWLSWNLTTHFQTGCSVGGKLVDKLIKTHQNIYSSLKCHPNLFEFSVAMIMRVLRHSVFTSFARV